MSAVLALLCTLGLLPLDTYRQSLRVCLSQRHHWISAFMMDRRLYSVASCGVVWCGVVWCGVVWCAEGAVTKRQKAGMSTHG